MVRLDEQLEIPEGELGFATSRSGGPGGQNVNKVESRVTLRFDVAGSPSLTPEQRERIFARLATRITKDGILHVTSQRHRTQAANREAATERFAELVAWALREEAPRSPTRPTRAARRRRLDEKRRRGLTKRARAALPEDG
jgi:ribosome-associated protein